MISQLNYESSQIPAFTIKCFKTILMNNKDYSLKKLARLAGILYLFIIIGGIFTILYVPSKIIVHDDINSTANNILAHELLFRSSIICDIATNIIWIFLALTLYRLLKQVNEHQAVVLVVLVLIQVPIVFIIEAFNISSIMVFKDEMLKSFEFTQRQDLAMSFLKINNNMTLTLEIFWGLWLIPFGQLLYKSGFIPCILGILLILGGVAYIVESLTGLILPNKAATVSQFTIAFYSVAEISTMLWLLIKGVKSSYK